MKKLNYLNASTFTGATAFEQSRTKHMSEAQLKAANESKGNLKKQSKKKTKSEKKMNENTQKPKRSKPKYYNYGLNDMANHIRIEVPLGHKDQNTTKLFLILFSFLAIDPDKAAAGESITIPLQYLVDIGMYSNIRTAYKGVNQSMDRIHGTVLAVKKGNRVYRTNFFTASETSMKGITIGLNTFDSAKKENRGIRGIEREIKSIFNWQEIFKQFVPIPAGFAETSGFLNTTLYYTAYQARQQSNLVRIKEADCFELGKVETIIDRLGYQSKYQTYAAAERTFIDDLNTLNAIENNDFEFEVVLNEKDPKSKKVIVYVRTTYSDKLLKILEAKEKKVEEAKRATEKEQSENKNHKPKPRKKSNSPSENGRKTGVKVTT